MMFKLISTLKEIKFSGISTGIEGKTMCLEKDKMIWIFKTTLKIRRFEEKVAELYTRGLIPGPAHLYIGQEAIAAGVCANLREDSYVTSTHRGHGHFIARGARLDMALAELLGKETGYCKGRSGSMHLAKFNKGIFVADSIVAAGIPIAVGMGLAIKMKKTDQVAVAFFGDGATSHGAFHEGVNLASVWKLPVIFVCENNFYAMSTPLSKQSAVSSLDEKAKGYGIPSVVVDGNDAIAVYQVAKEAVERAVDGRGPTFIECRTTRAMGHYQGDPQEYRPKEEIEECKRKDPIIRFRAKLIQMNFLTEDEADQIDQEILQEIAQSERFAIASPNPPPDEAAKYVYAV